HPSLGEEMHVRIFDPREQQIVGRLDGAAQIGQQEIHSASHARSPLRNTTRRPFLPRGTPEVKPSVSQCGRIAAEAGQTVAGKCFSCQRKVRAPQSRVLGNAQAPKGDEEGHRDESRCKVERPRVAGETRQPPPGATSNRRTTTWLAESAGRWLERRGNSAP